MCCNTMTILYLKRTEHPLHCILVHTMWSSIMVSPIMGDKPHKVKHNSPMPMCGAVSYAGLDHTII